MTYTVIIEKSPNGYGAYVPDLPGCIAAGETRAEVSQLIKEAIDLHIEELRLEGRAIPSSTTISELVEV
jgi:predicted RNase H-like HicB family nuclease